MGDNTSHDGGKPNEDDDFSDIEYWNHYTPSERVMMVWTMTVEEHLARGRNPEDLRFRRDVAVLKRMPKRGS